MSSLIWPMRAISGRGVLAVALGMFAIVAVGIVASTYRPRAEREQPTDAGSDDGGAP